MGTLETFFLGILSRLYKPELAGVYRRVGRYKFLILIFFVMFSLVWFSFSRHWVRIETDQNQEYRGFKIYFPILGKRDLKSVATKDLEKDQKIALVPEILGLNDECKGISNCSIFHEEDWVGWPAFGRNDVNSKILHVTSANFNNPNLFYKSYQPGLLFDFELKVTPKNKEKGNVVIVHNKNWRCIIAEANYKTVVCETGYNTPETKNRFVQYFNTVGKKQIKPDTTMVIKGSTRLDSNNMIDLNLQLDYITIGENKDKAEFNFKLPLTNADLSQRSEVGVGIIDLKKEGVEVEFNSFRLIPRE